MKLVCPKEDLSRGLQTVLRSVGARAGIPALSGVLMELSDTDLTLTTTDLELTTRVRVGLTGEAGKILLPARLLAEIVKSLPSDDVELVTDNGTVRVAGGRAKYEIRSLSPEDFPRVEATTETKTINVPGALLSSALNQVATAASRDETRPVLTGVLFEGEGDELRIVSTDSYRLAVRSLEVPGIGDLRVLIPARAVLEVARLAGGEDVRIDIASAQVGFHLGDVLVQSRLIEGEFPAYRQLLPENQPARLKIEKSDFLESVKRMAVLARDGSHIFLELMEEGIRLTCHAQGLGEGAEEIDGSYAGEDVRAAFNPDYLEAGVGAVESEQVEIDFTDSQRPALVHAPGDTSFQYLLMPIRVS
jgi:DNA polymerase III subunit beta